MNKQELNECVRQALGGTATPGAAALALEAVLQSIQEGINEDGYVKISDFGQFYLNDQQARRLYNPSTGEYYQSRPHRSVKFKAAPKQLITLL